MGNYAASMTPQFDLIGIVVSDMGEAIRFYRKLGLDFPVGSEDAPHAEAALPGGLRFALDAEATVRTFHPSWQAPAAAGRIGLAFRCDDVDASYRQMVGEGGKSVLEPFDAVWGQRYATIEDPDGNSVDLFAPSEVTTAG